MLAGALGQLGSGLSWVCLPGTQDASGLGPFASWPLSWLSQSMERTSSTLSHFPRQECPFPGQGLCLACGGRVGPRLPVRQAALPHTWEACREDVHSLAWSAAESAPLPGGGASAGTNESKGPMQLPGEGVRRQGLWEVLRGLFPVQSPGWGLCESTSGQSAASPLLGVP